MYLKFINIFIPLLFLSFAFKWYMYGLTGRVIGHFFFLVPILIFLYISIIRMSRNINKKIHLTDNGKYHVKLYLLYIFMVSLGFYRALGNSPSLTFIDMTGRLITFVAIALFSYCLFRAYSPQRSFEPLWKLVAIGLSMYVIVNILGVILGIENEFTEGLDIIRDDRVFGIWQKRVLFPFSANPQVFAAQAGILAILLANYITKEKATNILLYLFFLISSLAVIVACDSRNPLIGFAVVIINRLIYKKVRGVYHFILIGSIIILPLVLVTVDLHKWLSDLPVEFSSLTRKNSLEEIITLNNRTLFWSALFKEFSDPKMNHVFGFGAFGHIGSKLSYFYANMWRDPDLITLHNSFLQHLVDYGYVGFVLFVALIINATIALNRYGLKAVGRDMQLSQDLLLYLVTCSFLGNIIYFNNNVILLVFMLINMEVVWQQIVRSGGSVYHEYHGLKPRESTKYAF